MLATRPMWKLLSRLETAVVADEIAERNISAPVFVTGIARAGTTIVTEILSRASELTAHQYADFPFLFTPYWRNWPAQRSTVNAIADHCGLNDFADIRNEYAAKLTPPDYYQPTFNPDEEKAIAEVAAALGYSTKNKLP